MNLHEYQGKQLFAEYGLPVSTGFAVDTPEEAAAAAPPVQETRETPVSAAPENTPAPEPEREPEPAAERYSVLLSVRRL